VSRSKRNPTKRAKPPKVIPKLIDELISMGEWASLPDECRLAGNALWYSPRTVEARILESPGRSESKLARSRVPLEAGLPPHLRSVKRALNSLPDPLSSALLHYHCGSFLTFHAATGRSQATWYALRDSAYWYIAGAIQANWDG